MLIPIMKALVPISFFKNVVIMKTLDMIGSHLKAFWSLMDWFCERYEELTKDNGELEASHICCDWWF